MAMKIAKAMLCLSVMRKSRPSSDAAIPVAAAFLGALRDIITRRMSDADTSVGILFTTTCIVALASAATLPLGWVVRAGATSR